MLKILTKMMQFLFKKIFVSKLGLHGLVYFKLFNIIANGMKIKRNKLINPIRVILDPFKLMLISAIGALIAFVMLYYNSDWEVLKTVQLNQTLFFCIIAAFSCILIRDMAYMYRLKILTDNQLTWGQVFEVIFLWEFTSSVTPSAVGGAPVAIFFLNKEGINVGKATSIVLITALFDEIFFIVMLPVVYVLSGNKHIFPVDNATFLNIQTGVKLLFITSYTLILIYCIAISYGLFASPKGFKTILIKVFSLPILKRWLPFAEKTGDEIIEASEENKLRKKSFWWKVAISTFLSWTARYWVVNFLILGFVAVSDHFFIYARQLVMWIIMLISPTPGGSGIAEFAFTVYLDEFIPDGLEGTLAIIWRLISYYFYLAVGFILLPRWIRRVYIKRKLITFKRTSS